MLRHFCNQDGRLQISAIESFAAAGGEKLQTWGHYVATQFEKPVVCGGIGAAVLLYGGHFKTTAVLAQSFKTFDFEELQERWGSLRREYRRIRADGQRVIDTGAADGNANDALVASQPGAAPQMAVFALRARPLLESLQRLQYSVIGLVAMSLNENSAKLGLGIQLGVHLTRIVSPKLEVLLIGEDDSETTNRLRPYARMTIDCLCTVSGLGLAWALKGWAALWSSCKLGAELCMTALPDNLRPPDQAKREFAIGCITAAGFAWQAQYWGKPPQPWPLLIVFTPVRMLETGLNALV